jgi:hypothetical protein
MEAIIRGIHHVDWAHLLQKTWVPPAILPNGNRERKRPPWAVGFLHTRCMGYIWRRRVVTVYFIANIANYLSEIDGISARLQCYAS